MSKIARFVGNLVAFASGAVGTERTIFGDVAQSDDLTLNINADFIRGWEAGVDINGFPPQQFFSAASFVSTQLAAYLHQMGVAEWDVLQEYHIGSLCNINGVIYRSRTNTNIGNDPLTDSTNWNTPRTTSSIEHIAGSVAASAITLELEPTVLDFRSSTLSDGSVNTRTVFSTITVVVPSGATLGTISAIQSRLVLIAIDNAGSIELAVVNLAGGNNLDETTLISTTAISAAADSANVIYSTSARTNVPFRVVGFIDSTQATAGTWASAPTTIQGYGGQAIASLSSIGFGQKWQDLTASRSGGVTYYNTTGKPICMCATTTDTTTANVSRCNVDGILIVELRPGFAPIIIPPGSSYSITVTIGSIATWLELR